jgi:hypothetical protein
MDNSDNCSRIGAKVDFTNFRSLVGGQITDNGDNCSLFGAKIDLVITTAPASMTIASPLAPGEKVDPSKPKIQYINISTILRIARDIKYVQRLYRQSEKG